MIVLQNIVKVYPTRNGRNLVLDNISAVFDRENSVGILGRNGAGKSTLLRILAGAEQPSAGRVHRTGRISWPIGFSGGFGVSLTGRENCRFVGRIFGIDLDYVCEFAYDFSELGEYFDMPVRTYSSGMRSRLAFALSMAIDFDIYLVDEVTAVGDSRFQKKCRQAFMERRERSSVVMVSHDLKTMRSYCNKFAVLRQGQLLHFDSVEEAARVYEA